MEYVKTESETNMQSVIAWLDSLRRCAIALERTTSAIKELNNLDSVGRPRYDVALNTQRQGDRIGRLLVQREESTEKLQAERDYLLPAVSSCISFLTYAQQQSATPSAYHYLLQYYAHGVPLEQAAKAAKLDQWQARMVPRQLAAEMYALDPGRFKPIAQSFGRYGYKEFMEAQ